MPHREDENGSETRRGDAGSLSVKDSVIETHLHLVKKTLSKKDDVALKRCERKERQSEREEARAQRITSVLS